MGSQRSYISEKTQKVSNLNINSHESVNIFLFGNENFKAKIVKNVKVNLETKTNDTVCFST